MSLSLKESFSDRCTHWLSDHSRTVKEEFELLIYIYADCYSTESIENLVLTQVTMHWLISIFSN